MQAEFRETWDGTTSKSPQECSEIKKEIVKKITMVPFHKNKEYYAKTDWTVKRARQEINQGLTLLNQIKLPVISFFGSHIVKHGSEYYKHAKKLAGILGKKKYAILSGGGPGIMHAANTGATAAKTPSLGLKARLLTKERITDPIFTHEMNFHFLFVRRFIMSIKSEALIFYPGGYGTLNELFEYLALMQTSIVDTVPIICINKQYWSGLFDWLKNNPLRKEFLINNRKDLKLLYFVDDVEEVLKIIENKRINKKVIKEKKSYKK